MSKMWLIATLYIQKISSPIHFTYRSNDNAQSIASRYHNLRDATYNKLKLALHNQGSLELIRRNRNTKYKMELHRNRKYIQIITSLVSMK